MMINTNIAAQTSARLLSDSSRLLSKSLARLSSGSKLVSPEDDVAGMAVSMRFDAQINRISGASSNLGNAISFSQTQDGFLKKIGTSLDRMSELSMLAQDITKTDSDRGLYNKEFQTLASYISDVGTKDFNGVSLFSGNTLGVTSDSEGGTFSMAGISGAYLQPTSPPAEPINPATATFAELDPGITGDITIFVNGSPNTFAPTDPLQRLLNEFNAAFGSAGASWTYSATTHQLALTVPQGWTVAFTDENNQPVGAIFGLSAVDNTSGSGPMSASSTLSAGGRSPGGSTDISTLDGARSALTTIKNSINQLASDRATVGANIARLNFTSDQLGTLKDNLSAANSRIKDVDVAEESTQFARYNILVQAGTAMLSQANAMPQSILRLLG